MDYDVISCRSLPYHEVRLVHYKPTHNAPFYAVETMSEDEDWWEVHDSYNEGLSYDEASRLYEETVERYKNWEPLYHADNQPAYYSSEARRNYRGVTYAIIAKSDVVLTDPEDMCEPTSQTYIVAPRTVEGPCSAAMVAEMIAKSLRPSRCYCEHDCCGHRFGMSFTRWLAMDRLEVTINTARNY